jgi:hypothetical protein
MEGKYTKISAIATVIALLIAAWQIFPKKKKGISGTWQMTSVVESADLKQYIGMESVWTLNLLQTGENISGTAEKITVNSQKLNYSDRSTLLLNGTIQDDAFAIRFEEKGKLRETSGTFIGDIAKDTFTGTFISTASDSRGTISGFKLK